MKRNSLLPFQALESAASGDETRKWRDIDMAERVTIQDIADALGLSRNTVSKAINNTGLLADATREKILRKAIDMGYKQFSYVNIADLSNRRPEPNPVPASMPMEIALFSIGYIGNSHFSSAMLDNFQREFSQLGYSFTVHRIHEEDVKALRLPSHYNKEKTAGIICVEIFDRKYSNMLCSLGTPILFVDSPVMGMGGEIYQKYLADRIEKMPSLPDIFICANDFVALDLLQAFKKLGITVPKDVWLCGFDDSPESKVITPSLTTIHIHSRIMGFSAVYLLMSRIKEPSLNYRMMHTETTLIYRESTGDQDERRMT